MYTHALVGKSVKAAVAGANGYAGMTLVHLLSRHPGVELAQLTSRSFAGQPYSAVFPLLNLEGTFVSEPELDGIDVVFSCLPHNVGAGKAQAWLAGGARVVDMSADFRLKDASEYPRWYKQVHPAPALLGKAVLGLPELHERELKDARLIAVPGCYSTASILALAPAVAAGLVGSDIVIDAKSGVSGAGRKAELDYLFVECNESVRPYGVPKHRHLAEIEQELSIAAGDTVTIQFTPHLVPINRGILTTLYLVPTPSGRDASRIEAAFRESYANEPFVRLLDEKTLPDTKNVAGSNVIEIAWRHDPRTGRLIVMSAEDNLVKGASGQAVQCFNLMCGYEETAGLI